MPCSAVEWQWLAGILDAEGSLELRYRGAIRHRAVRIRTCDKVLIPLIGNLFGKIPTKRGPSGFGKSKSIGLYFTSKEADVILCGVLPYLYTKQPHARFILEASGIKNGSNEIYTPHEAHNWDVCSEHVRILNLRGRDAVPDTWPRAHVFTWPWLAGLIDGDGSISIGRVNIKNGRGKVREILRPEVKISLAHLPTIAYLTERLGINSLQSNPARGNKRPTRAIRLISGKIIEILPKIIPYLVLKRERAELALKIALMKRDAPNDGLPKPEIRQLCEQLVALNEHSRNYGNF